MSTRNCLKYLICLVLLLAFAPPAFAEGMPGLDLLERVLDKFEFLPEYHLTGDLYGMTH